MKDSKARAKPGWIIVEEHTGFMDGVYYISREHALATAKAYDKDRPQWRHMVWEVRVLTPDVCEMIPDYLFLGDAPESNQFTHWLINYMNIARQSWWEDHIKREQGKEAGS